MDGNVFGQFIEVLGFGGSFPIKYLGIPLHYDKLRREDIQPLIDKIMKRIAGWRGEAALLQRQADPHPSMPS